MPSFENFDKQIKESLKVQTNDVLSLKDETWQKINQELFSNNNFSQDNKNQSSKRMWSRTKRLVASIGGIAVAALLIIILIPSLLKDEAQHVPDDPADIQRPSDETPKQPGNSEKPNSDEVDDDEKLEDLFDKEIEDTIILEGEEEPVTLHLETNEEWRYAIYIDKERYEFIHGNNVDQIVPINGQDEDFPYIGMDIYHYTDTSTEKVLTDIKENIEQHGMTILEEGTVTSPVEGHVIIALGDGEPGLAAVHRYYVTTVDDGSIFSFNQMFYEEAWEGQAGRLDHILETFEWVSKDD